MSLSGSLPQKGNTFTQDYKEHGSGYSTSDRGYHPQAWENIKRANQQFEPGPCGWAALNYVTNDNLFKEGHLQRYLTRNPTWRYI